MTIAWIVPLMWPNNDACEFCDWNPWCLWMLLPDFVQLLDWYYCRNRRKRGWFVHHHHRHCQRYHNHRHRYRGRRKLFVFLRLQRLLAYLRSTAHQNTRALTKSLQNPVHTEKTKIVPQIL